ncbi:B12-binding domain-containing radical SAM protein [Pelobacter seleniigenes]|uniref:B12-binding domain-containing radical SAM protein n=1 Tax=Pelobacter seleniigenes TaxID=407188 RepID=UPI0004A77388|nr:cobalamin-dependent protein [Pelobacter seleniigenes]
MRILLINPPNCGRSIPEERYGITSLKQIFRGEPLSLETLAGNLPEHDVRILDLKADPAGLEATLAAFVPDLVGLTAMTCEANTVLALAGAIKKNAPATVVVGGVHASNDPDFFNHPDIDYIAIGLGKQSLREQISHLESGDQTPVPGIARTNPGQKLRWQPRSFSRADLADSVAPRYDLVDHYRPQYTLEGLGLQMGLVASAAGCPYDCNFCCIGPLTGGAYLTASIATVLRDIRALPQAPVIRLVDANSFGQPDHALALAEAIAEVGLRKQYLADVRSDMVVRTPHLLKRWREVGLRAVVIGFEEIEDQALGNMNKANNQANNREAIRILHDLGLTIVGDFIIAPDYTEDQFDRLGEFVREQQIELPMYTVLTPLPGTGLYERMKTEISNHNLDYYTLTNAVVPTRLEEKLFYQRYAALLQDGHHNAKV